MMIYGKYTAEVQKGITPLKIKKIKIFQIINTTIFGVLATYQFYEILLGSLRGVVMTITIT